MDQQKRIAIVTDSSCDLPDEVIEKYHITIVPLRLVYKTREYRDRLEISPEKVYAMLEQEVPKTSLPFPEDFTRVLDDLVAQGYTDVLYLSISAGLSGSYNLIQMLAMEYSGLNIEVVNTSTLSMGLGFLVLEGARTIAASGSMEQAVARIHEVRRKMSAMFVIRTLEYLRKGGRIGKVEGTIGTLLNLKPVIMVNGDGVYQTLAKARGFKKSVDTMLRELRSCFSGKHIHVAVVHGAAEEEALELLNQVRDFASVDESFVSQVSPVLGTHTGPGLLGLIAYESEA